MNKNRRFARGFGGRGGAYGGGYGGGRHGAMHTASVGGAGCGYNRRSHLCVQRDLVADMVQSPEQVHLRLSTIRTRIASYSPKTL
jgi:hypothetical protein